MTPASWCLWIMGDEPSAPDLRDLKPFVAMSGFFHSDRHVWKGPSPLYMQMWMQSFSFPIDGMASRASHLLQLPEDALTEASGLFLDDFLLDLHTRTHQTTDQSDDEDSEGALKGDAVEAGDYVVHETDDFWNGEDVDMDPREGIVSGWDLLGEDFIVEAEELRKFGHSLLHTS